jgi:hypothetical protein
MLSTRGGAADASRVGQGVHFGDQPPGLRELNAERVALEAVAAGEVGLASKSPSESLGRLLCAVD